MLVLAAAAMATSCGSSDVPAPENQAAIRYDVVPDRLQTAHTEVMAARFALSACRGPRERQAIDASDRRRGELETAIARRLGSEGLSALRAASERAFLMMQIERCAGEPGVARLRQAEQALAIAAARAGAF
jgi:hypothetical protein